MDVATRIKALLEDSEFEKIFDEFGIEADDDFDTRTLFNTLAKLEKDPSDHNKRRADAWLKALEEAANDRLKFIQKIRLTYKI